MKISDYMYDGTYSLPTGKHTVDAGGTLVEYGPVLDFTVKTLSDRTVISFTGTQPKAHISRLIVATISQIEFMADGSTYAVGHGGPFGAITQRKKINLSFGD